MRQRAANLVRETAVHAGSAGQSLNFGGWHVAVTSLPR